jgi:hypothetical protein
MLAAMLMETPAHPPASLPLAWHHTGVFWQQTGSAIFNHPFIILACAALPAAERAWVLMRGAWMGRGKLAILEMGVTLCRVLLCAVAVWAACSGREWHALSAQVGAMDAWQVALGSLGAYMAHHLRLLIWELLFFAAAFLLLLKSISWTARALAHGGNSLRDEQHRQVLRSVLRNLIFAPLALSYLVEMTRPVLR